MEEKIRKYARFLLEGCLRLTSEDKLFVIGYDVIEDFINIVIEEAQKLGIKDIKTLINKPFLQRDLYLNYSYEEIIKNPLMDRTCFNDRAREGYAFLSLTSPLPNVYLGVDNEKLAKVSKYQSEVVQEYKHYQMGGLIKWNISAVPNEFWAKDLGMSESELWNLILDICLINEDDPIKAWHNKMDNLKRRADKLNSMGIDKFIYSNGLGTNLEVGLPKDYVFKSADGDNIVNMPSEEVFTSPDRRRVEGVVYSAKVLVYNNSLIEDFYLKFKEGAIIEYDARVGRDVLKSIIDTDEGSKYLGEVAFVDYSSPISASGVVFKNTLFDENASCHLAIGAGFPDCILNSEGKSRDELLNMGINNSKTHVDFFVGTNDLNVKAVLQNGEEVVIMREGNFILEV